MRIPMRIYDDWADKIIFGKRSKPQMELPEDIYWHMKKVNPLLDTLIERFNCDIEW